MDPSHRLHEDAHRYRGNGAGVMATLRTAALNLLRLAGFRSIRSGMLAVMRDITALLVMVRRQPQPDDCYGLGSVLLIPRVTILAGMLVLQLY